MADNSNNVSRVETAARAVLAALDFQSPPESRHAATVFLESLKAGDVQILGATASGLVKGSSLAPEVRHYGLKLLQYLVRMRWEELTTENRSQLADLVLGMISEMATLHDQWVLKSQTAALVAEVIRHEGPAVWEGLLKKLNELTSINASHAELVITVFRWLPEDITVYNEDLEGERRRQLLQSLTQALPHILPLFYQMLETHFGAAVRLFEQNQLDLAKQHVAVVTATLNALLAYVEWAPVHRMAETGLIEACGFLLNAVDFRLRAGDFLKQIASRRRPIDETASAYDTALRRVFEVLCHASAMVQSKASTAESEDDMEFTECLCEALVALGSQNLQSIAELQDHITMYLQQMLGFMQHEKICVHYSALKFWLALLRERQPDSSFYPVNDSVKEKLGVVGPTVNEKKGISIIISDDVYTRLLNLASHWFLTKGLKAHSSEGPLAKNDEDLSSWKDLSDYRGRLLDLVRLVAVQRPVLAIVQISGRIKETCGGFQSSLGVLDSLQKLLEATINSIFSGERAGLSTMLPSLQTHTEGILDYLLSMRWNGAALVEIHGRFLDAMGSFLKTSSTATVAVLNKIFELLTSIPVQKGPGKDPLALEISRARLQVCTSFLRIAKAADTTVSAHMEAIWKTISALQEQGLFQRGEHNLIAEGFLIAGSAAGQDCEAKVLDCFLRPLQESWIQNNWQERYLLRPEDLMSLMVRKTDDNSQNEELWSMFHSITFIERVLKRCDYQHGRIVSEGSPSEGQASFNHPMNSHLMWIIPSVLKLLRCIHAFWNPSFRCLLPTSVQHALLMSSSEQSSILGETGSKPSRGTIWPSADSDIQTGAEIDGKETELRNWLKGVRDSGYSIIGLAAAHFDHLFFGYMDPDAVQIALLENIEAMELRHARSLLHFTLIPLVKSCPSERRELWLGKLLPRLLDFCEQTLSLSWMNLMKGKHSEGACKVEGQGLQAEVIEEKLLRDLSRETCALLAAMASPSLNPNLPSGDQLLQFPSTELSGVDASSLIKPDCIMRFVIQHYNVAKSCLSICIQALKWPDSEAVHKALVFCGATVTVAALTNDTQLQDFVARDLFTAVIEALTIDSNQPAQAELINLFRIIYLLMSRHGAPRQVLQSSPSITAEVLSAFDNALTTTASPKDQKQYIKSLLLQAGGSNLKALMAEKATTPITNVNSRRVKGSQVEETGQIGLASIT